MSTARLRLSTARPRRSRPRLRPSTAIAIGAVALAALAGCTPGAPEASPEPTPTSAPTSEPTSSPTPSPAPSASPPASADGDVDYCGDEYVLASLTGGTVSWEGTPEEQLAQAEPRGVFEPAGALDGLDVVCAATYRMPTDGGPVVAVVSEAVLERDDDAFSALEAWASANGYAAPAGATGFFERSAPPSADGTSTMKIFWAPLDGDNPTISSAADIVRQTGADPDAILVLHVDFTQG